MAVFEDELNDMTQAALDALQAPDGPFGIDQYVTEFPYGYGATYRTDIAGVQIDGDALNERVRRVGVGTDLDGTAMWTPLNERWRYLKTYLSCRRLAAPDDADFRDVIHARAPADGTITYDGFLEANNYSSKEGNWAWLEDKGFIQPGDWREDDYGDLVQPADVVDVPFHGDQWAFELKPRDWEHALEQASRAWTGTFPDFWDDRDREPAHGGYADFAVVVMDADHAGPALDHADRFEALGVGLASLDRDDVLLHVEPQRKKPPQWSRNRLDLNERTLPDDFGLADRRQPDRR
jgi:hypothetical protein